MKKKTAIVFILLSMIFFTACKKTEKDTVKPIINLLPEIVEIKYKQPYNILTGVSAVDNIDGDITENIKVDDGGFKNDVPGSYNIVYSVTDSSGNKASRMRQITVTEIRNNAGYNTSSIFNGVIPNEKPVPETGKCFPGAWNRKVASSFDKWLGMEGVITLPNFIPDEERSEILPSGVKRYLDNPSIYIGGDSTAVSDIGLTWEIGLIPRTNTRSTERFVFRPFWRYIHNNKNTWENAHRTDVDAYYFPGDKIRMSVFSPEAHRLQLKIEMIEPTTNEKYVEMRKQYGVYFPKDFLSPLIPSIGHGVFDAEFRRANAIDQVGNEGKPTLPTNAIVTEAIWHNTYLYRKINDEIVKVPFDENRSVAISCPNNDGFHISYEDVDRSSGAERVTIDPGNKIK